MSRAPFLRLMAPLMSIVIVSSACTLWSSGQGMAEPTRDRTPQASDAASSLNPSPEGTPAGDTREERVVSTRPHEATDVEAAYVVDPQNYTLKPKDPDGDTHVVLITVDDAPRGDSTEKLLDLFDRYHVRAIWFLNGIYAVKHPELVKKIVEHGHLLGNHTWSHPKLRTLDDATTVKEIVGLNDWIERTVGVRPAFFRPPYGMMSDTAKAVVAQEQMQMMNWSVGSRDWELKDVSAISREVLDHAGPGANILFHDKPVTAEAMETILKTLSERGYRFPAPEAPNAKVAAGP